MLILYILYIYIFVKNKLVFILTFIFNRCLNVEIFTDALNLDNCIPLYTFYVENYRPISLFLQLSIILEKFKSRFKINSFTSILNEKS